MARFLTVSGKVRILIAGWWFQTRVIFHFIYGTILRIDFHSIIFQDAYGTTNQNTLELIEHMLHSLVGFIKLDYVECQVGHLATSKCHLGQPLKYPIDQHECAYLYVVGVHSHLGMVDSWVDLQSITPVGVLWSIYHLVI